MLWAYWLTASIAVLFPFDSARTGPACRDCSGGNSSPSDLGSSDTSSGDDGTSDHSTDCYARDARTDPRGHSQPRTEHRSSDPHDNANSNASSESNRDTDCDTNAGDQLQLR